MDLNKIYRLEEKIVKFKADSYSVVCCGNVCQINYTKNSITKLLYRFSISENGIECYEFTARELLNRTVKRSKNVFIL